MESVEQSWKRTRVSSSKSSTTELTAQSSYDSLVTATPFHKVDLLQPYCPSFPSSLESVRDEELPFSDQVYIIPSKAKESIRSNQPEGRKGNELPIIVDLTRLVEGYSRAEMNIIKQAADFMFLKLHICRR